jgi:hypothetical protein
MVRLPRTFHQKDRVGASLASSVVCHTINVAYPGCVQVIQIAMGEKQKTLRPEIQLLNTILACSSQSERQKVSPGSSRICKGCQQRSVIALAGCNTLKGHHHICPNL